MSAHPAAIEFSLASAAEILESITDGFIALDHDWRYTYVNAASERISGVPRSQLLGKRIWDMFPGAVGSPFEFNYRKAAAEQITLEFEAFYPPQGIWYSVRVFPSPQGISVYFRDITQRREAGRQLQESEERFAGTFEQAAVGMAHVSSDGRWLRVNQKLCDIVGYSHAELLERTFQDITHPDDLDADIACARQMLSGQISTYSMEKRYFRKNGSIVWVNLTVSLLRSPSGEPKYFISIIEDINERKLAEQRLRSSEQKLNLAQKAAKAAVWDLDLATGTASWSPEFYRLCGLEPSITASYENFLALVCEQDRERCDRSMREALASQGDVRLEYRIVHPEGGLRWLLSIGQTLNDAPQPATRMSGITLDITDRRRAEDLRAAENRVLQLLAAGSTLEELLDASVGVIEEQAPGMLCSILLLDPDGKRLRHGAAPSLPAEYSRLVDGVAIGPAAGSCGTAAYRREQVVVEDIAVDPLWAGFRESTLRHGLRACWSRPILSVGGNLLGTFAMYYHQPRRPSPQEMQLIEGAARLAATVIERKRGEEALRQSEGRFRHVLDNSRDGIYQMDLKTGQYDYVSPSVQWIIGYSPQEIVAGGIEWTIALTHPEDLHRLNEHIQHLLANSVEDNMSTTIEYRLKNKDGEYRWISDTRSIICGDDHAPTALVGNIRDVTEEKRAQRALLDSEQHFRELAERNQRLVREVDHRVRNNLAGLLALLSLMQNKVSDVPAFAEALKARLMALAHVHQLLAEADWQRVSLRVLVSSSLASMQHLACHSSEMTIEGPEVSVNPPRVQPLTMVLAEWFTNSCKYGAHSVANGKLEIRWEILAAGDVTRVRLHWRERGGPPIRKPTVPSLGTELVCSLVRRELQGICALAYPVEGAHHLIEFQA